MYQGVISILDLEINFPDVWLTSRMMAFPTLSVQPKFVLVFVPGPPPSGGTGGQLANLLLLISLPLIYIDSPGRNTITAMVRQMH